MLFAFFFAWLFFILFSLKVDCHPISQAYNHSQLSNVAVNIPTGTFHFEYPIINAMGRVAPFHLKLRYRFNTDGMFDLPKGWTLDLDYIDGQTAVLGGKHWLIDNLWHDETGYASGLKYFNQHGSKFIDKGAGENIPGHPDLVYRYQSLHKDGSVNYFTQQGLLILSQDRFNNTVQYYYQEPIQSLQKARIKCIKDNYGNLYHFIYEPNVFVVQYPDGSEQRVYHNEKGIITITNALKNNYQFTYIKQDDVTVMRSIETPEGLLTQLTYTSLPYKNFNSTQYMPVVSRFKQIDKATDSIHHDVYYHYTQGNNFTGYPIYSMSDKGDKLIDSNNEAFRYVVEVERSDGNPVNPKRQHQVYTYNYLHLPTEIVTLDNGDPYLKTLFQYSISPFKYSRSTNYDKPCEVTHAAWNKAQSAYLLSDRILSDYDAFGNKVKDIKEVFDRDNATWINQSTKLSAYFTENFSLLSSQWCSEGVYGEQHKTLYTLSNKGKSHAKKTLYYKPSNHQTAWLPWQEKTIGHDDYGQRVLISNRWLAKSKPGIQAVTSRTRYRFDASNSQLSIDSISPLGHIHTQVIDTRNGQLVKTVKPSGEVTSYTYNAIGQLQTLTDPEGHVKKYEYGVYQTHGVNAITFTLPSGFISRKLLDASNRVVELQDWFKSDWRMLHHYDFNAWGKRVGQTDRLGLTSSIVYDCQERPVLMIDPWRNQTRWHYDDDNLITTQTINGHKIEVIKKSPWQGKYLKSYYPVFTNPHETQDYFIAYETIKDGFGQIRDRKSQLIHYKTAEPKETITTSLTYDPQFNLISQTSTGFDGIEYSQTWIHDIFNNCVSDQKMVTTTENVFHHSSYEYHYNKDNQLERIDRPKTASITEPDTYYRYDSDGRVIQIISPDGHTMNYRYNQRDQVVERSWLRGSIPFSIYYEYDADGRVLSLTDTNQQQVSYTYTENGLVDNIYYPDGKVLKYRYDDYDRLLLEKDFNGFSQRFIYYPEDNGLLSVRQTDNGNEYYYYGQDDNGLKGQLIARRNYWSSESQTDTIYRYGSYGFLAKSEVTNPETKLNYQVDYQYNPRGQLLSQNTLLNAPKHTDDVYGIDYRYDSLNRLIEEKHHSASCSLLMKRHYHYDGNSNLLEEYRKTAGVKDLSILRQYNLIDQLTEVRWSDQEESHAVIHDKNGRLYQDDEGNRYEYDGADYLMKVIKPDKEIVNFSYLPNGLLSKKQANEQCSNFYYDQHQRVVTTYQNGDAWSYLWKSSQLALITNGQNNDQLLLANKSTGAIIKGDEIHRRQYDGYGQRNNPQTEGEADDFGWNQEYTDSDTQLTYLRSRFYSPGLRQFLTRDPLLVANRYAYAHANPIQYIDPTGHSAEQALNYGLGASITALGVFGAIMAIPTGGASLSLSAVAGMGAGITTSLSGASLIGSQAALDSGNKVVAKALQDVSITLGVLAVAEEVVAIAPKVGDYLMELGSRFPSNRGSSLNQMAQATSKNGTRMLDHSIEALWGEDDMSKWGPRLDNVKRDIAMSSRYQVDGLDLKGYLAEHPTTNFSELNIKNAFFNTHQVHQGLFAGFQGVFMNANFPTMLVNLGLPESNFSFEVVSNTARIGVDWQLVNTATSERSPTFFSALSVVFDKAKNVNQWYFEYPKFF